MKVKVELEMNLDMESIKEAGLSANEVMDGIVLQVSDIVDGFEVTTDLESFDNTMDFFLKNGKIISKQLVEC